MAQSQVVGVLRALLTADTSEYDKAMKAAGQSTEKVAESLERSLAPRLSTITGLVKGMFGTGDLRRAEEYAQAVQKVGGAAKLVEADQTKVNRVLTDALERYRVLGTEAPAHIVKLKGELDELAAASKKLKDGAGESADFFSQKWAQIASGFTIGALAEKAITGLVNMGRAAVEDAGHLVDLAAKTGLSTEALQVYGQVAKETGGTIDSVANAVFKLGINVAEGSTATKNALAELGLGYEAIRAMRPEDQFEAIAGKLKDVEAEQERNRLGVALMGKGYADVAVAIGEGLDSIKDKTVIVGDAQLKAVDAMADAWDRFWDNSIKRAEAALGSLVIVFSKMSESWRSRLEGMVAMWELSTGNAARFNALSAGALGAAALEGDDAKKPAPATQPAKDLTKELEALRTAVKLLNAEQKAQIDAGLKMGLGLDKIADSAQTSAEVVSEYKRQLEASTRAQKESADAAKKLAEERKKLEAAAVAAMWKRDADEIAENEKRVRSLTAATESLNNVLAKRVDLNRLPGGIDMGAFGKQGGFVDFSGPAGKSVFDELGKKAIKPEAVEPYAESAAFKWGSKFSGTLIGALQGGGSVSKSIGAMAGEGVATEITKKLSGKLAGTIGKTVLGAIPIVGPLLGSIGGELIGKLFKNEGKDANRIRDSIKKQFGDAGGAGLAELVGKYKESTAVQTAYAEFLGAKTADTVQGAFENLKKALDGSVTDAEAKAKKMGDALAVVSSSTASIATGFTAKLAPAAKAIAELRESQSRMAESGDVAGAAAAGAEALERQRAAAAANQVEFDRLNRITLASFNAYIGQGRTALEAVQAVGPAIDQLKGQSEALGFAGSAAFDQLARWRTLTTDNAPLLEQVGGLNSLLEALGTLGAVDASTFADLQAQGVAAFEAMQTAGFTSLEASTQLAPLLETILATHEKTGLAIDEETQAIIDQARADGALKQKQISDQQIMIEGFSAMIKAVGGEIPAAFTKWSAASKTAAADVASNAKKAADGVSDAFEGLAFEVPVSYTYNGSDLPAAVNPDDLPQNARGGIATRPTVGVFGEAGPEALIPLDRANGLGPRTFVIETDGRAWARATAPYFAGEVQRLQLTR